MPERSKQVEGVARYFMQLRHAGRQVSSTTWAFFRRLGRFTIKYLFGIIGIMTTFYLLLYYLSQKSIIIQPISVPKELQDRGYTPTVAAIRLSDGIKTFIDGSFDGVNLPVTSLGFERDASSGYDRRSAPEVAITTDVPTFIIPTLGLSFDTLVALLRNLFQINPLRTISGEIAEISTEKAPAPQDKDNTTDGKLFSLQLRLNTNVIHTSRGVTLDKIDELFNRDAAKDILKFTEPFYLLGTVYRDDPDEAIKRARQIITDWPWFNENVARSHNFIGAVLLSKHRLSGPDGAVAELKNAIRLNNNSSIAHTNLGLAYREQGETDKAIDELQQAIKIDFNSATAHNLLGGLLRNIGRLRGAKCEFQHEIIALQNAVKDEPVTAAARNNLAAFHNNFAAALTPGIKEMYDPTCDSLIALVKRYSGFSASPDIYKYSIEIISKPDEYVSEYRRAIDYSKDNAEYHLNFAAAMRQQEQVKRIDAVLIEARKAVDLNRSSARAYREYGHALHVRGDASDADAQYGIALVKSRDALERDSRDASAYNFRGNVYYFLEQLDQAIEQYNKATDIEPKFLGAVLNRGYAWFARGNYSDAAYDLSRGIYLMQYPKYNTIWLFLARELAQPFNQRNSATALGELISNATKFNRDGEWPSPIIDLLLGRTTMDKVLEKIDTDEPKLSDERCEANFYIGEWLLVKGDLPGARKRLEYAAEKCRKDFVESTAARAAIKRPNL